jgi:hypothetical protein
VEPENSPGSCRSQENKRTWNQLFHLFSVKPILGPAMIAKIEGQHITILTRASPVVLAMLPGIEGRRTWLKGGGLRVENTTHNLEHLKANLSDLEVQGEVPAALEDASLFDTGRHKQPFTFKREPDPHQLVAFNRARGRKAFAFFCEQGTGKTKNAIDHACDLFLAGEIDAVLVATKKGVHRQWIDAELPKDHVAPYIGSWWESKSLKEEMLVAGEQLRWFSINYDALRGEKAVAVVRQYCAAHKGRLLIIGDESQEIKTHTTARHKQMKELKPLSSHRIILTGTPIAKDLTDEWAQLAWLDESIIGVKYLTSFRNKYCIMGGYEGRSVIGQRNMEEFRSRVDPYVYRITKQEIGYIPKRYSEWIYDLTTEQRRLLRQIKDDLKAELEGGESISVANATSAFTKVQQIINGFIIDDDRKPVMIMPVEKNPRVQAAMEWLESRTGKVVIWARFRADMQLLAMALEAAKVPFAQYHGGIDDKERKAGFDRFTDPDDPCRVFLANPQSAGTGLDGLQRVCTQALYYSNSFNAIDRWQSEDRIDRRGMIGGSQYTDLIAERGIDRYILRNLQKKKGLSANSLGDLERILSL